MTQFELEVEGLATFGGSLVGGERIHGADWEVRSLGGALGGALGGVTLGVGALEWSSDRGSWSCGTGPGSVRRPLPLPLPWPRRILFVISSSLAVRRLPAGARRRRLLEWNER